MLFADSLVSQIERSAGPWRIFTAYLALGLSAVAADPNAIPDAPEVPVAPLMEKPLPPSTPDAVGDQPSPRHVYISGHWRWQDGAYVWVTGHWELPPSTTATWVAPRWE